MLSAPREAIIDRLVSSGLEPEAAARSVRSIEEHPAIAAGRFIASRLRKTETLLETVRILAQAARQGNSTNWQRSSPPPSGATITPGTNRLCCAGRLHLGRPFQNGLRPTWLAVLATSRLRSRLGVSQILQDKMNVRRHISRMSLREYMDLVTGVGTTNDFYMVANNHVLQNTKLGELLNDIGDVSGTLNPQLKSNHNFLWFGPAGTVTCCSTTTGRTFSWRRCSDAEQVRLYPTHNVKHMYNNVGVFSPGDPEDPSSTLPVLERLKAYVVVLLAWRCPVSAMGGSHHGPFARHEHNGEHG